MRAVTWQGKRDVRVVEVPDPKIQEPTDAIIRITSTAICGSDLHLYEVLAPYLDTGDVLGHEPMGIVEEVGRENAFIFGLSSDEVMAYEKNGGYDPYQIFNEDQEIREVLVQLIDGTYSPDNLDLFRPLYESLLHKKGMDPADRYFILKDFRDYARAQHEICEAYRDQKRWAQMAIRNIACVGKFSSDRTIEEYVRDIWHLEKVKDPARRRRRSTSTEA